MNGRGTLDDAELRRTLEAVLSGAAAASRRAAGSSPPADLPPSGPPTGGWQGAVADPPPLARGDPAQPSTATGRWIVGRGGLAFIGLVLVAIGALLLAGTLGLLALDAARLADYWPLVFVVIGLVVLLEAWAPGRHAGSLEPDRSGAAAVVSGTAAPGVPGATDADELERRLDRLLASPPTGTPPSAESPLPVGAPPQAAAAPPAEPPRPPRAQPAAMVPRHGDVVAALVELQGLRRYGLISKRQYRAKRAELVARMTPSLVSLGWDEPEAGDVTEAMSTGHEAAGTGPGAGAQVSPGDRGPTGR